MACLASVWGKISVPGILSREGYTADSFSMCFGHDGMGRINFADKDGAIMSLLTQIQIGMTQLDTNVTTLFNSGTSFTCLTDPTCTRLSESFHSPVQDERRLLDSRIPFECCLSHEVMSWDIWITLTQCNLITVMKRKLVNLVIDTPGGDANFVPSMSLTTKGGDQYAGHYPTVVISTQKKLVYCLAIVKDAEVNINWLYDSLSPCNLTLSFDRSKEYLANN